MAALGLFFVLHEPALEGGVAYRNKPAAYWIKNYTRHTRRDSAQFRSGQVETQLKPILEIGTNAIPLLLSECSYDYNIGLPEAAIAVLTLGQRRYSETDVRVNARSAIRQLGPAALPVLFSSLRSSKDERIRRSAASCLADFHGNTTNVVPALIGALRDSSLGVRGHAAGALGQLGPEAHAAVEPLLKWLTEEPSFAAIIAGAAAIEMIDPNNPTLRNFLSSLASPSELPNITHAERKILADAAARVLSRLNSRSGSPQ